jgi:hypothetical protein
VHPHSRIAYGQRISWNLVTYHELDEIVKARGLVAGPILATSLVQTHECFPVDPTVRILVHLAKTDSIISIKRSSAEGRGTGQSKYS